MNATSIKRALRTDRVLVLTNRSDGAEYSLDNGAAVPLRLARTLTGAMSDRQADLFLAPQEDGLFPGFSQTWKAVL